MNLPIIFMYSGQGSQYYQMGKSLYEKNHIFQSKLQELDKLHQAMAGFSVLEHMYNPAIPVNQPFKQTRFSHPAIFMMEYALTEVLKASHIHPDMVLGSSMGEFAASVAAGIMTVESALQVVVSQASNLEKCPAGGMLAILESPEIYQNEPYLNTQTELAAINFPSHFVVSGKNDALLNVINKLTEKHIGHQLLPVSQAFHSKWVDQAKAPFLDAIKNVSLEHASVPLVSCSQPDLIKEVSHPHYWDAVHNPILFQQTIEFLEGREPAFYVDLGPSGTLGTFVKYNLKPTSQSSYLSIITPYGDNNLNLEKAFIKLTA